MEEATKRLRSVFVGAKGVSVPGKPKGFNDNAFPDALPNQDWFKIVTESESIKNRLKKLELFKEQKVVQEGVFEDQRKLEVETTSHPVC